MLSARSAGTAETRPPARRPGAAMIDVDANPVSARYRKPPAINQSPGLIVTEPLRPPGPVMVRVAVPASRSTLVVLWIVR